MHIHPNAALVAIDVQKGFDCDSWGQRNNPGMEANGRALIAAWRATGRPLIHTRHDSVTPGSPLAPGQDGNGFKAGFEPLSGELVVPKTVNSAFIGTDLEHRLRQSGIKSVVIVGATTNHCVETTTRMAGNLGFDAKLVRDATWTFDHAGLDGEAYTAEQIHRMSLANLAGEFAEIVTSAEVTWRLAAR